MGLEDLTRTLLARYAGHFAAYSGKAPPSLVAVLMSDESGGDPCAVSRDPVLIESGLSQVPLYRAVGTGGEFWREDVHVDALPGGDAQPPPRYDAVFFAGQKWLNSL